MKTRREGQILVLFALMLTVLLGFSALVVDIGWKMSSERKLQSVADAASLAGAQQLQPTTRTAPVTPDMQAAARTQALRLIERDLLQGASAGCDPTVDIVNCDLPGGQFRVSIKTPSPKCVDCAPDRSVQVIVEEPEHPTTFARLFGQSTWDLYRTSVAGLSFGRQYTIVTLRPPQPIGHSTGFDVRDFRIEGGSNVYVTNGDVATNSNMEYGGSGSKLHLEADYNMYYYYPYHTPQWSNPPDPEAKKLGAMVADPGYVIPSITTPTGSIDTNEAVGSPCYTAAAALVADPSYERYFDPVSPGVPDMGDITCFAPGRYGNIPNSAFPVGDTAILYPGVYYFTQGLSAQGSIIGGYTAGDPGVAIVIPQDKEFNINSTTSGHDTAIALNAGSKLNNPAGVEATAALNAGTPVVTGGSPSVKMTLMVTRDTRCQVVTPYPGTCGDIQNDAIQIRGNADLYLAGVQFMPTDNTSINSSSSTGYVGQIWAWTLKYSGGVDVNQQGSTSTGPGTIRIDTACSPGEQYLTECSP